MVNNEMEIFETAYKAIHRHLSVLDKVSKNKEIFKAGTGIEGWFQLTLLYAFLRGGYNVRIAGKVRRDCDIIINDIGIELRAELAQTRNAHWFISCLKKRLNADMFLFLTRVTLKDNLFNFLKENGYVKKSRELNPRWMLWLIKKEHGS